jgi:hypothetical protein
VSALRLRFVDFTRVELEVLDDDVNVLRLAVVHVGSGHDFAQAVVFPTSRTNSTASTGDDALDAAIRARAAEELTRLDAAVRAARDDRSAA